MTYSDIKAEIGITNIKAEIIINRHKSKIWGVLESIGDIDNFHPMIKKSYTITAMQNGVGARRICELYPMGQMLEEVVEWNEEKSFTMMIMGGKMLPPYHFMKGQIELMGMGEQTKVCFTFSYKLKYGFLGRSMNAILIKPQFKKAPPNYLEGLKKYVESLPH